MAEWIRGPQLLADMPGGKSHPQGGVKRKASLVAAAAPPAKVAGAGVSGDRQTIKQKADQKIREHFRGLTDAECDLIQDPATGLSLRSRLERDIGRRQKGQPV